MSLLSAKFSAPPGLGSRFQQPDGWRWHTFTKPDGIKIRFGTAAPKGRVPDAVVVCLQGLSEFTEKYFELANDLLARNLGFWMMDWRGQGKSTRLLDDPMLRHARSFEDDVGDLHYFIKEYIKHSAVHPEVGRIPLVMLGHSTGANIGLRYLEEYPQSFACAAFTSPLLGIKALKILPGFISLPVTEFMGYLYGTKPVGAKPAGWNEDVREDPAQNIFSSDELRRKIHNAWCLHDPSLQVGQMTYGWLHAAHDSCMLLRRRSLLSRITPPCLIAIAGREALVDNDAAKRAAAALPAATLIEFPDARHEILMETDAIRNEFLAKFMDMLTAHKVKDKLKPF